MTINTRSLDKSRPQELKKGRDIDAYFLNLERILSELSRSIVNSSGSVFVNNALFQTGLDELRAEIANIDPNLTADSASITADNTYISVDIA